MADYADHPQPRIEVTSAGSPAETAAAIAAVEAFVADIAPPPDDVAEVSTGPWQRTALAEGIAARQVSGYSWG